MALPHLLQYRFQNGAGGLARRGGVEDGFWGRNAGDVKCHPQEALGCRRKRKQKAWRIFPGMKTISFMSDKAPVGRLKRNPTLMLAQRKVYTNVTCQGEKVTLKLRLENQVQFGEHHALIGSAECMGSWQHKVMMRWTETGWVADLDVDAGAQVEYKYVVVLKDGNLRWEGGPNRVLEIPHQGQFEVISHWDNTQEQVLLNPQHEKAVAETSNQASPLVANESEEKIGNGSHLTADGYSSSTTFVQEWKGNEVAFMKDNSHSQERAGKWDTAGLEGPALHIVEGDHNSRNWWRKLEVVRTLLTSNEGKGRPLDSLVYSSIYLKWINTGQIPCNEDGGHHRPNKHAEISRLIFRELEWISSGKNTSPKEFSVIRKIHPCLPSFKSEFTASVPLTRIRDIAHRNDIPHDLKQEIKHTIQNKLHRNAGPEDLVATEVLLSRVTKNPGDYSEAFIEQLKLFYAELKDFFNAGSLTEQLEGIRPAFDEHQVSVLDDFLLKKKKLDEVGQGPTNGTAVKNADSLISTLHALTSLRAAILKGLNSGLRNDAPDEAIAMRQKWRLCEIGLEDYSFVLLSRFINALNMAGGATWLAEELRTMKIEKWRHSLAATVLGIRQLGLSDWHQEECMALENELMAWQAAGITGKGSEKDTHNWALRLKATLDRARRLCESYTDTILHLYPESVQKLGNALGIPKDTIRTYAEAEIRASVVFQLAKLCSLMLKSVRTSLGGAGWDALMPGKVVGKLVEVERIVPGSLPSSESIILLVKKADGDEEVKAAGANVVGIILQHELPHLSHLGVRARQEKVVFVTCEDEEQVARVRTLLGQSVKLHASPDGVNLDPYETKAENELTVVTSAGSQERAIGEGSLGSRTPLATLSKPGPVSQSRVIVSPPGVVLELSKAITANAGAKAAACGKLAVLAESSSKVFSELGVPAKFSVPKGKVIPFGAMEAALQDSGDAKQFYSLLQNSETGQIEGGFLDNICNELQAIVSAQRLPKSVIDDISSSFPGDARLIVRSSANVEDLAGMSGAGLYESIPNVRPSDPETFGKAVAQVWASLYTRRAVLSRRMAGVPQKDAAMAVLVQELLSPNLSFVLHTVSPIDQNDKIVQAELAVGLGETLASGTRGSPWRLAAHKFDGSVRTLAYANFSEALIIQADTVADGQVVHKTIDYSKEPLSVNQDYTKELGQRLATAGFFLEQKFGVPQDIEGCVIGKEVFIVQARPQP